MAFLTAHLEYKRRTLEAKEKALKQMQESFMIMAEQDIESESFEINAINKLLTMAKYKTEIREIKETLDAYDLAERMDRNE